MQAPPVTVESLLGVWSALPAWAGVVAAGVGAVYLFFGRRLFRVLVVAAGAGMGFVLGRWAAAEFGLPPEWTGLVVALVVGAAAWPLWQVAIFLMGAVPVAILVGDVALSETSAGTNEYYLSLAAGFVLGGLASVLLVKAMSLVLTAGLGAWLVFVGVVAAAHDVAPVLEKLAGLPLVAGAIMGLLFVAGLVAQLVQGPPELAQKRKVEEADSKAAAKAKAEAERRYQRSLGRPG